MPLSEEDILLHDELSLTGRGKQPATKKSKEAKKYENFKAEKEARSKKGKTTLHDWHKGAQKREMESIWEC